MHWRAYGGEVRQHASADSPEFLDMLKVKYIVREPIHGKKSKMKGKYSLRMDHLNLKIQEIRDFDHI